MTGLALALALAVAGSPTEASPLVERRLQSMGTTLRVEVRAADRATALRASEAAVRALEATERRLSTWVEGSELSRLNRAPVGEVVALSAELAADLAPLGGFHRQTEGGFDPTVGALSAAWGLRDGGRVPSPEELARATTRVGWEETIRLAGARLLKRSAVLFDEGGFGKGIGLDRALAAAADAGATRIEIDLGGQIALFGGEETVGVAAPDQRSLPVVEVRIPGGSIATSGNGQRGIEVEGRRLGHLLDPRTGHPAPDWGSLTVWARSATAADAFSTGLYVLGPNRALKLAARLPGIEALALEATAGGFRARATSGLDGRARPLPGRRVDLTFVNAGVASGPQNEGDGERYATRVTRSPSPVPRSPDVAAAGKPQ